MTTTHGWAEVDALRKREILDAIRSCGATPGPTHAELDLTDRCNVACYFCNQKEVRTTQQLPLIRVKELLDELVRSGLKSVRLSGGGEPLAYKGINQILDMLAEHSVVIDNLTTNGVLLTAVLAEKIVAPGRAREILFSVNAVDAVDYHRIMQVKPEIFQMVADNIMRVVALRGSESLPTLTVQFLIDGENFARLSDMYKIGCALGVDRIKINTVHRFSDNQVSGNYILCEDDFYLIAPEIERVLYADASNGKLVFCFPFPHWHEKIARMRLNGVKRPPVIPKEASAFREENGGCFFAWYSVTVRGNGDLYPCCMLLEPSYRPLGNILTGSSRFADHWNGRAFQRLRAEMRDVLLTGSRIRFSRKRFERIEPQCVNQSACELKNIYFRNDADFYAELDAILKERRQAEIGLGKANFAPCLWWDIQVFRILSVWERIVELVKLGWRTIQPSVAPKE